MIIKKGVNLYKPFFSFDRKHLRQWTLAGLLVLGNIAQAIFIGLINSGFNHFFGVLALPGLTGAMVLKAAAQFLLVVISYGLAAGFNAYIVEMLTSHLNFLTTRFFVNDWLDSKAYFGVKFLEKIKVPFVSSLITREIFEANRYTVKLGDNFLNILFSAMVGVYGLWKLSMPLSLSILGIALPIPGYMALGAIIYALSYNFFVSKLGDRLQTYSEKEHDILSEMEARIHHAEKNAESIELLKEKENVKISFLGTLKQNGIFTKMLARTQAGLAMFTYLNQEIVYFMGIFLSIPQIIAKQIHVDSLFVIGDYFSRVVYLATWQHDNYEDIIRLKVLINQLDELQEQNNTWKKICHQNQVEFKEGKKLIIKDLEIKTPTKEQSVIFSQKQFSMRNRKRIVITGESASGKSTLFRTITGLWPYAQGKITTPRNIHVLPQKPYFPFNCTIYEVMSRRSENDITAEMKHEMNQLMNEFKLRRNLQSDEKKKDWSDYLSGGEQQRVAIIRAILEKPLFLLMDEPFSALDPKLQALCKALIKKYLPNTKIICIEHNLITSVEASDSDGFYDLHVTIEDKQLIEQIAHSHTDNIRVRAFKR